MESGSKLDYILTTRNIKAETRVIKTLTSDHNIIMTDLSGEDGALMPRRNANKEMFFSGILNEIKEKHIKYYLRYVLQMIGMILRNELTQPKHEEILAELKTMVPIVVIN